MNKLMKLLALLTAQMALPVDQRDEKALAKHVREAGEWLKTDEAKAAETINVVEMQAELAALKAANDTQAEALRAFQKNGIPIHRDIVAPAGLTARREMLADQRAFLADETATRFGAWFVERAAALWNRSDLVTPAVREIAEAVRADMEPGTGTAGGYLIPDEFRPELIRNVEAEGTVFVKCRRIPLVTTGSTKIPKRTGGLTAYWTAPAATGTRTAPTFDLVTLTPEKLMVLTAYPNEFARGNLLADLGQFLGLEITHAMAYALDDAIVNGDGTATYGGITGILQSANISAVTAATGHDTFAEIDGTDISNVIAGLSKSYALAEAFWLMSLSVKGGLRALKATTGVPLYQRGGNGEPNTIDDYPYVLSPRMTAAGSISASTLYAAFGDLRYSHVVGMIRNIEIAQSEHALFESDMTAIRAVLHVDCQEADATAVVTAKTAA